MRFIRKQHEPPELKKWKRIIRPTASTNWKELDIKRDEINPDKSVKQIVTESLMVEQGFICCYCEQQIPPDPEHPHHRQIEHYKPQDHFPETRFEYNNFGACCLGGSMSNEEEQKEQDKDQPEDKKDEQEKDDKGDQKEEKEDEQKGDDKKDSNKDEGEKEKPQQPKDGKLTKEQAEQLLKMLEGEEAKLQEKLDKPEGEAVKISTEKDW